MHGPGRFQTKLRKELRERYLQWSVPRVDRDRAFQGALSHLESHRIDVDWNARIAGCDGRLLDVLEDIGQGRWVGKLHRDGLFEFGEDVSRLGRAGDAV